MPRIICHTAAHRHQAQGYNQGLAAALQAVHATLQPDEHGYAALTTALAQLQVEIVVVLHGQEWVYESSGYLHDAIHNRSPVPAS